MLARPVQNGRRAAGLGESAAADEKPAWEGCAPRHGSKAMENAALIGLSRQMAIGRELEVVANNIANLNTIGYKADGSVFEEYLSTTARHGHFQGSDRRMSYVSDRATWHDFKQGGILQTGNPLDVAIDGDSFLVVGTPQGDRYTRNGALKINATGQLVTNDGLVVQGDGGPIIFQNTDSKIAIAEDGTIRVRQGADTKSDAIRGKLRVVRFEQVGRLQKDGAGLFKAPDGVIPRAPVPPQRVRVLQGALEQSNVSPILEMARMVEISRTYTQIQGLLQGHSDMRRNSLDKLAEVPA
jgi:flagellar basal-body rod protein FlgF